MRFQHTEYEPLSPSELIRTRYMQAQYFPPSHIPNNAHILPPMPREDNAQRKRPKYTRSKTGCLTCRAKKIKCDESKPTCIRCTHGQRDCTWPETVPVASDSTSQMSTADNFDCLPSTAECSGISDASSPPTRNHTPPIGHHLPLSLPALSLRRQSEPYLHINQIPHQPARGRRQSVADFDPTSTVQDHSMHQSNLNPGPVSMIPGTASYPSRSRYENNYSNTIHPLAHPVPRRGTSKTQRVGDRFMPHPASGTQWEPPILPSLDPIDPFFQNAQERNLVGYASNDYRARYQ
ncbi:hypothetical protein PILCRDRAFT_51 [Piloderma croceum F 1598]|uniref:Zn(2)-C6 fungal-type domain-containing protein n=1 Tax=Piloderma croceum (strain F 1598) TaxID=765440 RepID=A0A0C3GJQ7_PILCF|nr:hypothetical protein PILCRDRAFT_51 [Piloderma croceum F 1598]